MAKAKVKTEFTPEETTEVLGAKALLTSHQFENAVQIAARFNKPGRYTTARKAGIPVELLTEAEYARVVAEIDRRSPTGDPLEVIAKSTWDGKLSQ